MNCDGCALIMSDVVNNDISVISSGCTSADSTTSSDALKIIRKYSLEAKFPKTVISHLKKNLSKKTFVSKYLLACLIFYFSSEISPHFFIYKNPSFS